MKKPIKKKMSIEDLAISMNRGFKRVENLIETKIDELAISTAKGFESVDKRFDSVEKRLVSVEEEIKGVKNQLGGTNKRIDDYAETKVAKIEYKDLSNRVGFVEKKLEIKK